MYYLIKDNEIVGTKGSPDNLPNGFIAIPVTIEGDVYFDTSTQEVKKRPPKPEGAHRWVDGQWLPIETFDPKATIRTVPRRVKQLLRGVEDQNLRQLLRLMVREIYAIEEEALDGE